jgi:hypothetical protein
MAYLVYLLDPLSSLAPNLLLATMTKLQTLFDPIAARVPAAGGIKVISPPTSVISPKDNELVVYLLPEGITVVDQLPREKDAPWQARTSPLLTHHWGMTRFNANGAVSEAYVKFNDADMLSKLAFHECMHNKLRLTDDALHGPRNRICGGLHCASIGPESVLLPVNITAMAGALLTNAKQWTGALQVLVTARALRDGGDQLLWDQKLQW